MTAVTLNISSPIWEGQALAIAPSRQSESARGKYV